MIVAYLQLAASMALVGVNVVVLKLLAEALPVPLVLGLRCGLAALILLAVLGRRALVLPGRGAMANIAAQAVLGSIFYNVLLMLGVQRTGALEAGLVLAALPAVVAVGAFVLLREALPVRRGFAAALAGLGMAALALGRGGEAHLALLGDALVFGAVLAEAGYVLLAKSNAGAVSPLVGAFWMQVIGTVLLAPVAATQWAGAHFTAVSAGLLVFHGVTASVLAVVLLWYAGLRRVPGGVAGVFAGLLPLSAGAAAIVVLHEAPGPGHLVGAVLMLGSIGLATWPGRAAPALPPAATSTGLRARPANPG